MITIQWIIQRRLGGELEALTGPGAQVNALAALTAKWPVGVGAAVNAVAAAGWADDDFCLEVCLDRFHIRSTASGQKRSLAHWHAGGRLAPGASGGSTPSAGCR